MDKKNLFAILGRIYVWAIAVVFTVFCLIVTEPENVDKARVFQNRFIVSLMFWIPGFIFIRFKNVMLKIFYKHSGLIFEDDARGKRAVQEITNFGSSLLITGIAIVLFALIFYVL